MRTTHPVELSTRKPGGDWRIPVTTEEFNVGGGGRKAHVHFTKIPEELAEFDRNPQAGLGDIAELEVTVTNASTGDTSKATGDP